MQEFITEHILPQIGTFLGVILTGIAGFLFGKRKQRAEVSTIELEAAANALKYYREMVDDLGSKLKNSILELDKATQRIKELEDTVELLTDELKKYKQLNRMKEPPKE